MPVQEDQLDSLRRWVWEKDEHADSRLEVLSQALQWLERSAPGPPSSVGREIAEKLDRWRYQFLSRHAGRVTAQDQQFLHYLDTLAGPLAQRPTTIARRVRQAILDEGTAEPQCGPPDDRDELIRRATRLTAQGFSSRPTTRCRVHPAHDLDESGGGGSDALRRMVLYAPLYLSNYCTNYCTYCGFRFTQETPRVHLSGHQAWQQARILMERGFRHLLLVAGDFPRLTSPGYLAEIVHPLRNEGLSVGVEIAAQTVSGYRDLVEAGATSVTLYQETYDERLYSEYHPRGSKSAFDWRLEALDRAAEAGMGRLGLGVLLGLNDPWQELAALTRHGRYLQVRFPNVRLSFSLPRIHNAPAGFQIRYPVSDQTLVELYCLLRLSFPEAHLVLSTREPPDLRNELSRVCITQMSAGSSTAPGGYGVETAELRGGEQFPVCDLRSVEQVMAWLTENGFEILWDVEAALG
jgi:2-iminoacetate synthase